MTDFILFFWGGRKLRNAGDPSEGPIKSKVAKLEPLAAGGTCRAVRTGVAAVGDFHDWLWNGESALVCRVTENVTECRLQVQSMATIKS